MKERPRLLFLTISPLRAVLYRPTRRQLVVLLCTEPAHGTRYGCAYRKRRKDFSSYRTAAKPIYDWTAAICHKEHMLDDSPLSLLFFLFLGYFVRWWFFLWNSNPLPNFPHVSQLPQHRHIGLTELLPLLLLPEGGGTRSLISTRRCEHHVTDANGYKAVDGGRTKRQWHVYFIPIAIAFVVVVCTPWHFRAAAGPAFLKFRRYNKRHEEWRSQPRPPWLYIFAVMN